MEQLAACDQLGGWPLRAYECVAHVRVETGSPGASSAWVETGSSGALSGSQYCISGWIVCQVLVNYWMRSPTEMSDQIGLWSWLIGVLLINYELTICPVLLKKKLRYIEFAWWTMNCVLKQRFSCCIDQVVICQFTALYGLVHIRLNCFLSWLIDVLLVNYELTICPFFWKTLLHWICLVNYELCFEQEISLLDLLLSSLYLLSFVLSIVWV